jgi:hypothetical protein
MHEMIYIYLTVLISFLLHFKEVLYLIYCVLKYIWKLIGIILYWIICRVCLQAVETD